MRPDRDLEAMLEARLAALARRDGEGDGEVSFAVEGSADAEVEALWQMLQRARQQGEEAVAFDVDASARAGRLAREQGEHAQVLSRMMERLSHPIIVETREAHAHIKTTVGWTGDMATYVARGTTQARSAPAGSAPAGSAPAERAPEIVAHEAALEASLVTNLRRLRLLTLVLIAAGKIAAMIATPSAALRALPIAYKCVRDIYQQWAEQSADTGETPWL